MSYTAKPVDDDQEEKPKPALGDIARTIVGPALEIDNAKELLLHSLNENFELYAKSLEAVSRKKLREAFKFAKDKKRGQERNEEFRDMMMGNEFDPVTVHKIKINKMFIPDITVEDITRLHGYHELHRAARDAKIAISVSGFTKEEKTPPAIVLNMLMPYEDGRTQNVAPGTILKSYPYPDLHAGQKAPKKRRHVILPPEKKAAQKFTL